MLLFYFVIHKLFQNLYQIMELKHSLAIVPGIFYLSIWSHAYLLIELVKMEEFYIRMNTFS